MSACTRSYGLCVHVPFSDIAHDVGDRVEDPIAPIMAKNQLLWLILILSNEPKEVTVPITLNITETGPRKGTIPIYAYDGDRDRLPDRLANAENGLLISLPSG